MKTPLELLIVKMEVFTALAGSFFAIISPDQHLSLMGWSLLGGILGGFVGAYLAKPKGYKEYFLRWAVNIAASIVIGIGMISYLEPLNHDHPVEFLTLLASAFGGPLIVLALPIGIPILWNIGKDVLISFLKRVVEKYSNKSKS